MEYQDIQDLASIKKYDVREITKCHYRLIDKYNKYIADIYIKMNKNKTLVIQNRVLLWNKNKWLTFNSWNKNNLINII